MVFRLDFGVARHPDFRQLDRFVPRRLRELDRALRLLREVFREALVLRLDRRVLLLPLDLVQAKLVVLLQKFPKSREK